MIGRLDKSVCEWHKQFLVDGEIPESKQGKYQRSGVMWSSEELNKKSARYIRENASNSSTLLLTSRSPAELNTLSLDSQGRYISARKWKLELAWLQCGEGYM